MISRRSAVLGSLMLLPIVAYIVLGGYALWTSGLMYWIWWLIPACWLLMWGIAHLWRPQDPSAQEQHSVEIPYTGPLATAELR